MERFHCALTSEALWNGKCDVSGLVNTEDMINATRETRRLLQEINGNCKGESDLQFLIFRHAFFSFSRIFRAIF